MKLFRLLLLLLSLPVSSFIYAQSDSCHFRISLLTCSPGEELYSTFGHTAIRVTDSSRGMDIVFNYGTFDDSDPNFYVKFTRGIMVYALSVSTFRDFMMEYQYEHRSVIEQTLQLTCAEKDSLFEALRENAQEANRFYDYHFHTDNCTTRARDVVVRHTAAPVTFKSILPKKPPTFRQLIHQYLDDGGQYWSKFGIDILLGSHLDKRVTNEQAMFLPDYLMKGFDSAAVHGHPLVAHKQTILHFNSVKESTPPWLTPLTGFSILLLIITALSFGQSKTARLLLNLFDIIFFLTLGLLGLLLAALWIGRVDTVCRNNFNLVWALPTHLPVALIVYKKKKWLRKYFRVVLGLSIVLLLSWFLLPQQLNPAIAPILGLIMLRSYQRSKS